MGILSDTHGRLAASVERCLAGCELVLHAGDVGSAAVLQALAGRGTERLRTVLAVRGNNDVHEKWAQQEWACLDRLPFSMRVKLSGGDVSLVHGDAMPAVGRHARLRREHADACAVVYGHSHRHCVDLEKYPWILNPGAGGAARTHGGASCLLLEVRCGHWAIHRFCDGELIRSH